MLYEVNEFDVLDFMKSNVPSDATRRSYRPGDIDSPCDYIDFVPDAFLEISKKHSHNPVSPISELVLLFESDIDVCVTTPQVGILLLADCGSINITVDFSSSSQCVSYDLYFDVCIK